MRAAGNRNGFPKIRPFLFLLAMAWLSRPATEAGAYFPDSAFGVRPAGMAGVFTAVADDTNALLYNPAGLACLQGPELNGMYAAFYPDLDVRLPNNDPDRTGCGFLALGWGGWPAIGGFGLGWTQLYSALYQENDFILAYGRRLWESYGMKAGVSLHGRQWAVSRTDFMSAGLTDGQKWIFTADAGVLAAPFPGFQVGLSLGNILPADAGLTVEERAPLALRAGAAYLRDFGGRAVDSVLTALEFTLRNRQAGLKLGAEVRLLQAGLAVRAGIDANQATFGLGYQFWPQPAVWQLEIDYAYAYPFYLADTAGSHRLGIIARMNRAEPTATPTPAAAPAVAAPAAPAAAADRPEPASIPETAPAPIPEPTPQINIGYELDVLSASSRPGETREKVSLLKNDLQSKGRVSLRFVGFAAFPDLLQAFQKAEIDAAVVRGVKLGEITRPGRATPVIVLDLLPQTERTYCLIAGPGRALDDMLKRTTRKLGYLQPEALDAAEMILQAFQADPAGRITVEPQQLENVSAGIFALKVTAIDLMIVEEKDLGSRAGEVKVLKRGPAPTLKIIARRTPELEKLVRLAVDWPRDPKVQPVLKFFRVRKLALRNNEQTGAGGNH